MSIFRAKQKRGCRLRPRLYKYTTEVYNYARHFRFIFTKGWGRCQLSRRSLNRYQAGQAAQSCCGRWTILETGRLSTKKVVYLDMGFPARSIPTPTQAGSQGNCGSYGCAHGPAYLENSLIDPRFDFDSCGVGFVAQLSGEPSHQILQHALTALGRLEHRGAVAADGKSSDGVGVTVVIPRGWLLEKTGMILPDWKPLGVGVVFLPEDDT